MLLAEADYSARRQIQGYAVPPVAQQRSRPRGASSAAAAAAAGGCARSSGPNHRHRQNLSADSSDDELDGSEDDEQEGKLEDLSAASAATLARTRPAGLLDEDSGDGTDFNSDSDGYGLIRKRQQRRLLEQRRLVRARDGAGAAAA